MKKKIVFTCVPKCKLIQLILIAVLLYFMGLMLGDDGNQDCNNISVLDDRF